MSNPAKKTAVQCSGMDRFRQSLPTYPQLGGKCHVQQIGVRTRVNEDRDSVSLSSTTKLGLELRSRGHSQVHGSAHQRPLDDW